MNAWIDRTTGKSLTKRDKALSIDVHSHAIPVEALGAIRDEPFKYGLALREDSGGNTSLVLASGHAFPLYAGFHDPKTRLADMDARGVFMEIVTPAPNAFSYDLPPETEVPFIRLINDGIAAMCGQAPDRLFPGGALPLQDIPSSCAEVERLHKAYGVRLVLLNTNVLGRYYDDPAFLPLFATCERLGVTMFFHPQHNNLSYGLDAYYLVNLLGNPVDTTVSAARLVLGGALKKHPNVNCLFAHGGGFLPYQRGRIERGFAVRDEPGVHLGSEDPPAGYFDRLCFDTITHSPEALAFLIASHGADRILLGSDYPFDMADLRSAEGILGIPGLSDGDRTSILRLNAERMLAGRNTIHKEAENETLA